MHCKDLKVMLRKCLLHKTKRHRDGKCEVVFLKIAERTVHGMQHATPWKLQKKNSNNSGKKKLNQENFPERKRDMHLQTERVY